MALGRSISDGRWRARFSSQGGGDSDAEARPARLLHVSKGLQEADTLSERGRAREGVTSLQMPAMPQCARQRGAQVPRSGQGRRGRMEANRFRETSVASLKTLASTGPAPRTERRVRPRQLCAGAATLAFGPKLPRADPGPEWLNAPIAESPLRVVLSELASPASPARRRERPACRHLRMHLSRSAVVRFRIARPRTRHEASGVRRRRGGVGVISR